MKEKITTKIFLFIITLIVGVALVLGLSLIIENKKYNDKLDELITENHWTRNGGGDTETIYFNKNGDFGYYCACGNPVDDSDAYSKYIYDKESNTIRIKGDHPFTIEDIKIIEVTEYKLTLNIKGKKVTFESERAYLLENPLEFAGIKLKSKGKENIDLVFNIDGTYEAFDNNKKEFALSSDYCFYWTYNETKKQISLNCNGEEPHIIEVKDYSKDNNKIKLYFKHENKILEFEEKE